MVVQGGSIVEAALHQILYRAQNHTKEGVPNIPADELRQIQAKEIGRFNNIIQTMKKHKLLGGLGEAIYTPRSVLGFAQKGIPVHIGSFEQQYKSDAKYV
jgi:hypothetical protein